VPDDDGIAPALSFVGLQSINIFILDQINNVLLLISKHALVLQQPSMSYSVSLLGTFGWYRNLLCTSLFRLVLANSIVFCERE